MPLASLPKDQASEVIAAGDTKFQKAMDGIEEMEKILNTLADDDRFQYALSKECVQKAIKHWLGIERLKQDEKDELFDEEEPRYQDLIMPALKGFRKVEAHCKRLGRPFPTIEVMRGERKLRSKPQEEQKLEEVREEAYQTARHVQTKQSHGMMIGLQLGFLLLLWLNRDTFVSDYAGNLSNLTRNISSARSAESPMRLGSDSAEMESDVPSKYCSGHTCHSEAEESDSEVDSAATCEGDGCSEDGHQLESVQSTDEESEAGQPQEPDGATPR